MPCHPARARELVRKGRAVRRFRKGFFYIQLLDREVGVVQPVACGIDPGSKWEGFTVKSEKRTFANIHADAVTHVKEAVEVRREMRRGRRYRKTPCRKPRHNRAIGGIPPSTKARWGWKVRLASFLADLYPISVFAVEDVSAATRKGQRRWNTCFSPLEVGKQWFYAELEKIAPVIRVPGDETKKAREALGLSKTGKKSAETFWAHCVDAWTLASMAVGGTAPENTRILRIAPLCASARSLHLRQPGRGGARRRHGGTVSLGLRRGTEALHPRYGFCYVGGHRNGRLSLHRMEDGKRLCQDACRKEIVLLGTCSWRVWGPKKPKSEKGGKSGAPPQV